MKCSLRPEWLRRKKMAAITCSCGCHGGATVVHGASDDRAETTPIQAVLAGAEENDGETCRMCGDEPDERSACPECGACWECASDDCGICCDRIAYKIAETQKATGAAQ